MEILVVILGLLVVCVAAFFLIRRIHRRLLVDSLNQVLLLIKVPKKKSENSDFKVEINEFEQFLGSLTALKKPVVFEIAVHNIGEEIFFYVSAPRDIQGSVAKQIQGIWPGASVELVRDDYTIFNPEGAHAGAYVTQNENQVLPIRTYLEIGADSFSSILGSFNKIDEIGEGMSMQLLLRPAPKFAKKNIQKSIEALKKGTPLDKISLKGLSFGPKAFKEALSGETKKIEEKSITVDEEGIKMLQSKISKPLFEVNLRLITSAPTPFQANEHLDDLMAGLNQFGSPKGNEFKIAKVKNPEKLAHKYVFREFENDRSMILNTEELASIYHFPISSTETPRVKWLKAKEAPPPPNLPREGTFLGTSSFQGQNRPVYITSGDRSRHVYVVGQTGTGKTTLLASMMIDDILAGKGVAVIDPHGEFAEKILSRVPKDRKEDVIYFNPADLWHPLGLNMLDYHFDRPEEKTFIVNEMQSIFNKLFSQETMGPMFEQYMRNALLLLMEDMVNEPATLIEVPRIFTDVEYRKRKLARISNPTVIDFWEKEAVKAGGEASLANMTPYITSKFNNFISNDYMRPIIGQAKSAFNFREVMDQGKILLVNLSKGRIGDINAGLLGMVFVGKILMAALSRVDIVDEKKRKPFYLYIDEFQNFTTDSIASILSEARKYGLSLTIAHQFIAQLTEEIRDAVFGNVGSQVVMRVGAQDAEFLVKQFDPVFDENDLMNIDNLNAYAKLLVDGQTAKPFNMKVSTKSWEAGDDVWKEELMNYSRDKYGADRREIEEGIYKRLRE